MQSSAANTKSSDNSYRSPQLPGHLYNRGGIFYFRLVLTEKLRLRFGRVEIRLSLRTAYRRRALELSRRLYAHFYETVENEPMISYKELRRRLNIYLQMQLEDDHNNILARPVIKDAPVMPGDLADYCEADIYRHRAECFQKMTNDSNDLNDYFRFVKQELARCGMLLPGESNKNNRLQIVKAYFESQVTLFRLLEKRCQGDYLTEESIVSADFGKLPKRQIIEEKFAPLVPYCDEKALQEVAESNQQKVEPNSLPKVKPSMLYSEAIQVFVADRISEGSWKPHMVAEHEGHLKSFLEVMGDMTLDKINREIVRKYRDTISKLPPN